LKTPIDRPATSTTLRSPGGISSTDANHGPQQELGRGLDSCNPRMYAGATPLRTLRAQHASGLASGPVVAKAAPTPLLVKRWR
jgi:hypothetical protein